MGMLKVYVAGKWEDRYRIKNIMNSIRDLGFDIDYDWTEEDPLKTPLRTIAEADFTGVMESDILVLVAFVDYKYAGSLVELGAALALDKEVLLVGEAVDYCIFTTLPQIKRFKTLNELYKYLESK